MFIGQYVQKIDEKNRIIIPTKFRNSLGENAFITIGHDKCLAIYTEEGWNNLQVKLTELSDTKKDYRMYVRTINANAKECDFDTHGRVNLAPNLIEFANIQKDIVIVGCLDHAEVWSKESWDEYNSKAIAAFDELSENW